MSETDDLYYIQNRGFCGDCLLWHRVGLHGYTTNLDKAARLTKAEAESVLRLRKGQDYARSVAMVDAASERHLNNENLPKDWVR